MKKRILYLCLLILTCTFQVVSVKAEDKDSPYFIWMWNGTAIEDKNTITNLKEMDIDNVFVNVGYEPKPKVFYLKENPKKYDKFIKDANKNNIQVEALYGNPEWALKKNLKNLKEEVNTVLNYNKKYKNRFSALHLDIEPQALENFDKNKNTILKEFVSNLKEVRKLIDSHNKKNKDDIKLNIDLPYWIKDIKVSNKFILDDIIKYVDGISVMNYTNDTENFISFGEDFLKKTKKHDVDISIGFELQKNFKDVSFYDLTEEEFTDVIEKSMKKFGEYKNYNGLVCHTYLALIEYNKK